MIQRIRELFTAIDSSDAKAFGSYLHNDVRFIFGNADVVQGRESATAMVEGFFSSIKSLQHDIHSIAESGTTILARGIVTYTRHAGTTLTVPFANVFAMDGEHVKDYQIYVDASRLYTE